MRQHQMPSGVRVKRYNIDSKRIVVKKERSYQSVRNIVARWPQAGLQELGKYMLVCVLDGFIDYQLGFNKIQCGSGYFMLIPPGIPIPDGSRTYVDVEKCDSCDVITFLLHPGALEMWTSHGHLHGRTHENNRLLSRKQVVHLFEMLIDELLLEEKPVNAIIEDLLHLFFATIHRELEAGRTQMVPSTENATTIEQKAGAENFVERLSQVIETNLSRPLKLKDAARNMYYSPAQFSRVLRHETGKGFVRFVTDIRLQKARHLLEESEWSVTVIQEMVGFGSLEYFCTVFKKNFHATPQQYREQHRKKTIPQKNN